MEEYVHAGWALLQTARPQLPTTEAEWAAFAVGIATALLIIIFNPCQRRSKRGYGSGENNNWSRRINTNRPNHEKKHFKLEHVWRYEGPGSKPDMDVVRTQPLGAVSAKDHVTGYPLSGHLVGRHTWRAYPKAAKSDKDFQDSLAFNPQENPNAGDKLLRAQLLEAAGENPSLATPGPSRGVVDVSPTEAMIKGWDFYSKLLCEDGHWAGDYGGPLFLLPGLMIVCAISGFDLGPRLSAMITYTANHQQADGGWGLHLEGPSTVFCTTLNYLALRLHGIGPDEDITRRAREFILQHGGAVQNPHWGKFWMAVCGCYEWDGVNPISAELWILPRWFPFHPGKMWCHSRMPYLPMSYIYTIRAQMPIGPLQMALRKELFLTPYDSVDWNAHRNTVAEIDLYAPHTWLLDAAFNVLRAWEKYCPSFLRKPIWRAGRDFAISYVHAEDLHTNFIDIGPVNKVINMLAVYFEAGNQCEAFKKHAARLDDYLWVAEDGMKMQGYNGSQLWDTAFATQALASSGLASRYPDMVARIQSYLDASQIKEDVPMREKYFRTISKGGWPFSTNDHGWPIADCTSEGMKAALAVRAMALSGQVDIGSGFAAGFGALKDGHIAPQRFFDAVNVVLDFHNPDGGWATYEEMRGAPWYEWMNPAEVWADLMIDYTYTELTSACVTGLTQFRRVFPDHRPKEVSRAIDAGVQYIRDQQREDGSWYGSWAVCFTYGCWFGVEALTQAGEPEGKDKLALEKCCQFLLAQQREDGGWGESYLSCLLKEYSQIDSTAPNTAWALLALIHAQCPDATAIRRGIDFLIRQQTRAGDWRQEWCSGIFNRTCAITYTAYRNLFPLWALAAYVNEYKYYLDAPVQVTAAPAAAAAGRRLPGKATAAASVSTAAAAPAPPSAVRKRAGAAPEPAVAVASPAPKGAAKSRGSSKGASKDRSRSASRGRK